MNRYIANADNIMLLCLFIFITLGIRVAHDKSKGKLETVKIYLMRSIMGGFFALTAGLLFPGNVYIRKLNIVDMLVFFAGLFGMELGLFLLDPESMRQAKKFMKELLKELREKFKPILFNTIFK